MIRNLQRTRWVAARRSRRVPWFDWVIVPSFVILAVVIGYPIVRVITLSFQRFKLLSGLPPASTGGENYVILANDPIFWEALRNTGIYTFGSVAVGALLGLALALLTEHLSGGWRFVRSLF